MTNKSFFVYALTNLNLNDKIITYGDSALNNVQLKILELMSQVTNRMDLTMFAQKINLAPTDVIANVQELTNEGLVHKTSRGYGVTDKGKTTLKAFTQTPEDKAFHFYARIECPTAYTAQSLIDFYNIIQQIDEDSLNFHLSRGDFEKWFNDVLADSELAKKVEAIKKTPLQHDIIRKELLNAIDQKYGLKDLL